MPSKHTPRHRIEGFTLVELSIVLVIIGLIVGAIFVGQDLITAARICAQISQIDKYNSAVNAFKLKYNALPGDMLPSTAAALGLFARTGAVGNGNGDGYVTGIPAPGAAWTIIFMLGGENVLFWTDLSVAGMIDGGFNDNSDAYVIATTDTQYAAEMPRAKIGNGNYVFVNGVYYDPNGNLVSANGFQIINIAHITAAPLGLTAGGVVYINVGLTPLESFTIDQKIDDGLPLSGNVIDMGPYNATAPGGAGYEMDLVTPSSCALTGTPRVYNVGTAGISNVAGCSLRFNAPW